MAKEHQRSNREAKKPKATKPAAVRAPSTLGTGSLTPLKGPKKSR